MIKCEKCGRFVKWDYHITYTPYQYSGSLEVPEPVYLHPECYEQSDKELINKTAWIKPYLVNKKY